jgi:predicted secreted hydrolase
MTRPALVFFLILLAAVVAWVALRPEPEERVVRAAISPQETITLEEMMESADDAGFQRADAPRSFSFPHDHGPHPGFRTEWWYFTGNLTAADGRAFGYQFTIFRNALASVAPVRESSWGTRQVYMGHLGLTDVAGGTFYSFERFSRGALGLAGAEAAPFRVWLEDWSVEQRTASENPERFAVCIAAQANGIELDLDLTALKPIVLQGDDGLSLKGSEPGNASYYYSISRLATRGDLVVAGERIAVQGLSWLDREWSTSALASDLAGWDWFALQLSDGTDLMVYLLRLKQGGASEFSRGSLIDGDGRCQTLDRSQFRVEVLDWWESPLGGDYPAAWSVAVPARQLDLTVTPLLAGQEHDFSIRYWEGAVAVTGTGAGKEVDGSGYVELTGYAEPQVTIPR